MQHEVREDTIVLSDRGNVFSKNNARIKESISWSRSYEMVYVMNGAGVVLCVFCEFACGCAVWRVNFK